MLWTSRSLSLMLAPVTVLLAFGAGDLLALINNGEWSDAAQVTSWLAWAAFLRSLTHIFPQVFYAVGRPSLALLESVASAAVLSLSFILALALFGTDYGILSVGWAWFVGGALLLALLIKLTQRVIPLSLSALWQSLKPAGFGAAWLIGIEAALTLVLPSELPPMWALAVRAAMLGAGYMIYLRVGLHMRWSDLKARPTYYTERN